MNRTNDWSHPLPFGDSVWVKKSDVEPLVKAVRKMLDEIYEFGSVVSNEYVELAESAYIKLVGDEPANTGLHTDGLCLYPGCDDIGWNGGYCRLHNPANTPAGKA